MLRTAFKILQNQLPCLQQKGTNLEQNNARPRTAAVVITFLCDIVLPWPLKHIWDMKFKFYYGNILMFTGSSMWHIFFAWWGSWIWYNQMYLFLRFLDWRISQMESLSSILLPADKSFSTLIRFFKIYFVLAMSLNYVFFKKYSQ